MSMKESFNKANANARARNWRNAANKVDLLGQLRSAGMKDLGDKNIGD